MEAPVFAEIIFSASSAKILSFPPFDCTGVSEKELVGGGGEDVAFTSEAETYKFESWSRVGSNC